MSAIVSNILNAIRTTCATELGASYQQLPFVHEVTQNNIRTAKLSYGVRPLESNSVDTVTHTYTLDHRFEVILTDTIVRGADDSALETSIKTLYDKADEIFKAALLTKLGLPTTVLNVFEPSTLVPELYEKEKIVALRLQFLVKYRNTVD